MIQRYYVQPCTEFDYPWLVIDSQDNRIFARLPEKHIADRTAEILNR